MIGRLKDLTFTRDGRQLVTVELKADFSERFDELYDGDIDIYIDRHRDGKSTVAVRYCWALCTRIAERLSDKDTKYTKEDIYRSEIREVGIFRDEEVNADDADLIAKAWSENGTGWMTEIVDDFPETGRVILRLYYGISRYNSEQMSRLVDNIVQDCAALGIETETPAQIENIKSLWANAPKGR